MRQDGPRRQEKKEKEVKGKAAKESPCNRLHLFTGVFFYCDLNMDGRHRYKYWQALLCAWVFLFGICVLLYSQTLGGGFMFEDESLVTGNHYIKSPRLWPKLMSSHVFALHPQGTSGISSYYRPLQSFSYALDYLFWGLNPLGYRLSNILLHSTNALLLGALAWLIFKDSLTALLAAVVFCAHPVQVFNVAYISPRSIILETLFVLLALVFFILFLKRRRQAYFFASLFVFLAGILSREGAMLLPALILLVCLCMGVSYRKTALYLLPYVAITLAYLLLRRWFLPTNKLSLFGSLSPLGLTQYAGYLFRSFSEYLVPFDAQSLLARQYPMSGSLVAVLSLALAGVIFYNAILSKGRDKAILFGVGVYLVGMLPGLKLGYDIRLLGPVLSQHFLYASAAGFSIILARLFCAKRPLSAGRSVSFFVLLAVFCSLSVWSSLHYQQEAGFYRYVLDLDKDNFIVRLNLGNSYYAKGLLSEAEQEALASLKIDPNAWDGYLLLGNVSFARLRHKEAKFYYEKAAALNPASGQVQNNIALVYMAENDDRRASEHFSRALMLEPESLCILNNLTAFLIKKKEYRKALEVCEQAVRLDPDDAQSRINRGIILAETGWPKEAESSFREALRIAPSSLEALKNLGVLLANAGDLDAAVRLWEKAASISPPDNDLKSYLDDARRLKEQSAQ